MAGVKLRERDELHLAVGDFVIVVRWNLTVHAGRKRARFGDFDSWVTLWGAVARRADERSQDAEGGQTILVVALMVGGVARVERGASEYATEREAWRALAEFAADQQAEAAAGMLGAVHA